MSQERDILQGKKNMDGPKCKCPKCAEREAEDQKSEEVGMAFLIALMPLLTITMFSGIGLI